MPTDRHVDAPAASPSHVNGRNADTGELDALRAAIVARYWPQDAAEAHWVEELVFVAWRQERLRALELPATTCTNEPAPPTASGRLPEEPDCAPPLSRHQRRALKPMARQGRLLAA